LWVILVSVRREIFSYVLIVESKAEGYFFSESFSADNISLGLPHAPTIFLRRFFIIRHPLHVPDQTFFFAEFFEASDHLLYRFACPRLDFQHKKINPFFALATTSNNIKLHSIFCRNYTAKIRRINYPTQPRDKIPTRPYHEFQPAVVYFDKNHSSHYSKADFAHFQAQKFFPRNILSKKAPFDLIMGV
jgi:hypothetical protein